MIDFLESLIKLAESSVEALAIFSVNKWLTNKNIGDSYPSCRKARILCNYVNPWVDKGVLETKDLQHSIGCLPASADSWDQ